MGYAVIMFVIMLLLAVSIALSANHGITKDSQLAPLKAENIYAERETGKAQTVLTINNTCLTADTSFKRYVTSGNELMSGTYTLHLTVKNNGSTVLKPNNVTVFYNTSYATFGITEWKKEYDDEICEDTSNININGWPPLTYVCMNTYNIWIATPDPPESNPIIRLALSAENGASTIAPTTPTNFTGHRNSVNSSFSLTWNASYDEDGIAYYRLYTMDNNKGGNCPPQLAAPITIIPGNTTSTLFLEIDCLGCTTPAFYLTAVDNLGNEGVQTRTIGCQKSQDKPCGY